MVKYNANPKGWKTDDCVIRAIATATNQTWDKVFTDLNEIAFNKKRVFNDKKVYEEYLSKLGYKKMSQPRSINYADGYYDSYTKYTVDDFINELNKNKIIFGAKYNSFIITVAHHMTCVKINKDGIFDLFDTWDCSSKTIGNYYIKEEEK